MPRSTQEKIADLVRKSYKSQEKAKQLLNQAKRRVEEIIETKEVYSVVHI